jgi:beta-fructofuranosidase
VVTDNDLPDRFTARVEVDIESGTRECGLLLRSSHDGDTAYIVRLEPQRSRVVFDRWPRRVTGEMQWQVSGDVPFELALERPVDLLPGRHSIEVLVDGSVCVVVIDGEVALSARIYDRLRGRLGLFVGEGEATFVHAVVQQRSSIPIKKEAQ